MENRDYVVKQIDAEGEPIIAQGKCSFYEDDRDLVPKGFTLDCVQNTPLRKNVYVRVKEGE